MLDGVVVACQSFPSRDLPPNVDVSGRTMRRDRQPFAGRSHRLNWAQQQQLWQRAAILERVVVECQEFPSRGLLFKATVPVAAMGLGRHRFAGRFRPQQLQHQRWQGAAMLERVVMAWQEYPPRNPSVKAIVSVEGMR